MPIHFYKGYAPKIGYKYIFTFTHTGIQIKQCIATYNSIRYFFEGLKLNSESVFCNYLVLSATMIVRILF